MWSARRPVLFSHRVVGVVKRRFTTASRLSGPPSPRRTVRFFKRRFTTAALPASGRRAYIAGIGLAGLGLGQLFLGSGDGFFEYSVITKKLDPNDLAEFYGNEDFMQIFCVLPIVEFFLMRGAKFDDQGVVHTWGFPFGSMEAEMTFTETEADLSGDGEEDTVIAFQKKERFTNFLPFFGKLFNIVLSFGYELQDDGTCKITHRGETFSGFWVYRLLFHAHARYVIWAAECYVDSEEFSSDEMEDKEHFRKTVPVHELKHLLHTLEADIGSRLERHKQRRAQGTHDPTLVLHFQELEAVYAKLKGVNLSEPSDKMEVHITVPSGEEGEKITLVIKDDQARELISRSMQLLQPEITETEDGRTLAQFRRPSDTNQEDDYLAKQSGRIMASLEHVAGAAAGNTHATQAPVGSTWSRLMANLARRRKAVYEVVAPRHTA